MLGSALLRSLLRLSLFSLGMLRSALLSLLQLLGAYCKFAIIRWRKIVFPMSFAPAVDRSITSGISSSIVSAAVIGCSDRGGSQGVFVAGAPLRVDDGPAPSVWFPIPGRQGCGPFQVTCKTLVPTRDGVYLQLCPRDPIA